MKMGSLLALVACLSACSEMEHEMTAATRFSMPLTATQVRASIDDHGARDTVSRLFEESGDDEKYWDAVLSGIASGEAAWLGIVTDLKPGTDAYSAESLDASLAIALPNNPVGVLSLVSETLPLEKLCTNPLIEPTEAAYKTLNEAQLRAVQALGNDVPADVRNGCLAVIRYSISVTDQIDW